MNLFGHKNLFIVLLTVLAALCLCEQPAYAQKTQKILIVKSKNISSYNQAIDGFKQQSLPEWNLTQYDLGGTTKNASDMIYQINENKPDLVLAVGAKALVALNQAKIKQPVVFCMAMKPSAYDLQEINVTGISLTISPEEQFNILTSLTPKVERLGVLLWKTAPPELLQTVVTLAQNQQVEIVPIELESEKEIPQKLRTVVGRIDALWMLDDAYIHSKETLDFVVSLTIKNNIRFMAISEVFVREGAMISLSPSYFDNGKQTAKLVRKIFDQNLQPKDIPISYHENPDLVINTETARKIGVNIPLDVLDKAKPLN
jgi:putative ABC transport system substrate-binding protein